MCKYRRTFLRSAFFAVLFLVPFWGICQITTPTWVNDIGGPGADCLPTAVGTDAQNNIYLTGNFSGTVDFDPGAGVHNLTAVALNDVYVAKYNTQGNLIWAVSMGGNDNDQSNSLTVDTEGNPIISGKYSSTDFDTDPGASSNILSSLGKWDAFVIKLNTNGGFMWAKSIGGTETDYAGRVSVDAEGNMITTIAYKSTVNVDGNTFIAQQDFNGLIIKYSAGGNLIWAINLNDTGDCQVGYGDFDKEGNFVVCGTFTNSVNFNPIGTASLLNGNGNAIFIAKYTPQGQLIWAKPIYGKALKDGNSLCINSKNDIFLAGTVTSQLDFGPTVINSAGLFNVFLAKYTSQGDVKDVKRIGGTVSSLISNYSIVCSFDDNIYLSGYFYGSIDFNTSPRQDDFSTFHSGRDFFLAKYDEDLNYKLAFTGGSDCQNIRNTSLAVDKNNDLIFTGGFCSTVEFSASFCRSSQMTAKGIGDTYLAKYKQNEATRQGRITSFTIPQQIKPTHIDQEKLKITVTVPAGTNIGGLTPTIGFNPDLTLEPNTHEKRNFTSPVTYKLFTSCYSLNYVAEIVFSDTVVEKQLTLCNGKATKLTGDILNAVPESYSWQLLRTHTWAAPEGAKVFNEANYTTETLKNTSKTNIILNFRRKIVIGGVTSYDSYYGVTVFPEISDNTIATPSDDTFCGSKDIDEIQGSIPTGGDGIYAYQWEISPDDISWEAIPGAVLQSYDPPVVLDTVHYRRIIKTCGQILTSNTIHYYIWAQPPAPVVQNDTICAGNTATLVVNEAPGLTIKWYTADDGGNSIHSGNTYTTPPVNTNTTLYTEAVTAEGCASVRTPVNIVLAEPLPAPLVTPGQVTLNSVAFNWGAVSGATGYELSLNGGAFAAAGNVLSYTAGSLQVGQTVSLSVRATGALNCQLGLASPAVSATAITSGVNQIFVPNVFSPNGDGNNDVLYVRSQGIKSLVFYVYNQWGEMIFRSASQSAGWDGTYKGSLLPVGVYVYYAEATMLDGSKINKKGTVTLIL